MVPNKAAFLIVSAENVSRCIIGHYSNTNAIQPHYVTRWWMYRIDLLVNDVFYRHVTV